MIRKPGTSIVVYGVGTVGLADDGVGAGHPTGVGRGEMHTYNLSTSGVGWQPRAAAAGTVHPAARRPGLRVRGRTDASGPEADPRAFL